MNECGIKKIRKKLGLNQEKLAQLLDVHTMTVSKWERGVLEPTPYQAAMMDEFEKAASKSEVKLKLKHVLIAAGVVAAVYLLLKYAKE
jgi:DNA-binding transcriptional regulator YiaG